MLQGLVDSFCQCFGTVNSSSHNSAGHHQRHHLDELGPSEIPSPESKRRTRSLALQDKQWDALFTEQPARRVKSMSESCSNNIGSDQQPDRTPVAKAKLSAARKNQKRKRGRGCCKDTIFRCKQPNNSNKSSPISTFLSNNPVFMRTLCFATPIRESTDAADDNTVVSESGTLNTAEDTISSTIYYERTKLAGLSQKNPPMPLFPTFQVGKEDAIQEIVKSHSHSSVKLLDMYRRQSLEDPIELSSDETPPVSPKRHESGEYHHPVTPPPAVTNISSDSSKSSA